MYTYITNFDEVVDSEHGGITLVLALKPNGITMKKEVLVFDALDMIGNIGGYLGLLLGWSILSLFNVVQKKISKRKELI